MNLQESIDLFLGEYRPTTRRSYRYPLIDMRNHLGPARPLTDVAPVDLVRYMQNVRNRESVQSPSTINKYIKTIRRFFNWAVDLKLLESSPASALKREKTPRLIDRDKAMTDEELDRLLDWAKWFPRKHALVLFLADTGCRAGGAAGVKVSALDVDNATAEVIEKGDKKRPVFYGHACARALRTWLIRRDGAAGEYVFSHHGEPISAAAVSQIIRRMCLACGIRSLGSHSFRHRKGYQLADKRIAVSIAATALGHEAVETTLNHYYPRDFERAARALRELSVPSTDADVIIPMEIKKEVEMRAPSRFKFC